MFIGHLAEATATAVETIRFYERQGLIPAPQRGDNNYRRYTARHAERLAFIRHCRNLDMSLDEIRSLLRLRETTPEDCTEVNIALDTHVHHVTRRIRELQALEKELKSLRARCKSPRAIDECVILKQLEASATPVSKMPTQRRIRGAH